MEIFHQGNKRKIPKPISSLGKIQSCYFKGSGLVVSLKTNIFGLRVPQEEKFQFYLRITLTIIRLEYIFVK